MATVVMVHGIAQQKRSAEELQAAWIPALACGVREAGHEDLADKITVDNDSGIEARMAFYGDLFLAADAQGDGSRPEVDPEVQAVELDLARAMLERATEVGGPRDQARASVALAATAPEQVDAQGFRATIRPAVEALARIGWLADLGQAFGERYVWQELRQASLYLTKPDMREAIQDRVNRILTADTRLVIGHSLGSVVSYEALHRASVATPHFVTMGSPLGLRGPVTRRLEQQPPAFPLSALSWLNLADHDDLVAGEPDLAGIFGGASGGRVVHDYVVDNGKRPHDAKAYLGQRALAAATAAALALT
ncbi:hypothetical protein [Nocardioides okcheonensis]|uniref:hypothetical protein n=1 Tax=Nocardioides okcheonensis TaxID=2894081 RepID=UPI001E3A7570|nr:hypothetical protein [Nocardioides okcheonensis]UFN44552.1 hypothetical protein LN652_21335 [Nocardioides okcheonensis]